MPTLVAGHLYITSSIETRAQIQAVVDEAPTPNHLASLQSSPLSKPPTYPIFNDRQRGGIFLARPCDEQVASVVWWFVWRRNNTLEGFGHFASPERFDIHFTP
jgi:hypothetical protein